MKCTLSLSVAISLLCCAVVVPAEARTRPRFGGRVKLELRQSSPSYDPAFPQTTPEVRDQVSPLIFETLLTHQNGAIGQGLAASWKRLDSRRYAFTLRDGVTFSDGSDVDATAVIVALSPLLPDLRLRANGTRTVIVETPSEYPSLPAVLTLPRFAIAKHTDTAVIGSGAYVVQDWQPGKLLLLKRNPDHWGAVPSTETVSVAFTDSAASFVSPATAGDDAMQLTLEQARNLRSSGTVQIGTPNALYALLWLPKTQVDDRVKQALALSLVKDAMAAALGKELASAGYGFVPQSMSGYEFLLKSSPDIAQARSLVRDAHFEKTISLAYPANDLAAQFAAERVAVNARDGGLNIQPYAEKDMQNAENGSAMAVIGRLPAESLDPAAALYATANDLKLDTSAILRAGSAEQLFNAERELLKSWSAIPLVHVVTPLWSSPRLHDLSNGVQWRIETSWVESGGQ